MGQVAFVFPGQGAQAPGMGQDIYRASPAARQVFERAEALFPGLKALCFEGPMERLTQTANAQPALLAVEAALLGALREAGLQPDACAGFSLGEWTACHAAGLLSFDQAFGLVTRRAQWMQQCADAMHGGMTAVMRLTGEQVRGLAQGFRQVWPVNYNAPEQTVVAGMLDALPAFEDAVKQAGGRSMRLNVSGAFHSPVMQRASDLLAQALLEEQLCEPAVPVYSNVDAQPYTLARARETLALQLAQPVQWVRTVERMAQDGIDTFVEVGPGRVLSGLIAKTAPHARCLSVQDMQSLHQARAELEKQA